MNTVPPSPADPVSLPAAAEAAFAAYRKCYPPDDRVLRQAALSRLARPRLSAEFETPWMDDSGVVHPDRARVCLYGQGEAPCHILLCPGADAPDALGFSFMLSNALLTGRAASFAAAMRRDPGALSAGESMRLCRSFAEGVAPFAGGVLSFSFGFPARERGYLASRLSASPDRPSPLPPWEAAGYGLCLFAGELLHRLGIRPEGRAVSIHGRGALADAAAGCARRMGMHPAPFGAADVILLCGPEHPFSEDAAERSLSRRPLAVLEGAPLACTFRAAARFAEAGIPFVPSLSAGCGGMMDFVPGQSRWDAERQLRRTVRALFAALWDTGGGDLYTGTYAAAVHAAVRNIMQRGV